MTAFFGLASLRAGFFLDDYLLLAHVEASPRPSVAWLDVYDFGRRVAGGDVEIGYWTRAPGFRMHFLRPLSSLLFALDHVVAGRHALSYHLHTLLWLAVLVALLQRLYARLLGPRFGGLALLVYVLATRMAYPIVWISNRHMLVTSALLVGALLAYDSARTRPSRGRWLASAGLGVAALLASEAGLTLVPLLLAYELVQRRADPVAERAKHLAVPTIAALGYLGVYFAARFGASENRLYTQPLAHPLAVLPRLGNALTDVLLGLPADAVMDPRMLPAMSVAGFVATPLLVGLVALAHAPQVKARQRELTWLALGGLLACAPVLGGLPSSRLYLVAAIGGAPLLVACFLSGAHLVADRGRNPALRALGALACLALGLTHLVAAPLLQWSLMASQIQLEHVVARVTCEGPARAHPAVFLSAGWFEMYAPVTQPILCPGAERGWIVYWANHTLRVRRDGPRAVRVEANEGELFDDEAQIADRTTPFAVGDTAREGPMHLRVSEVGGAGPRALDVSFDRDVEGLAFWAWSKTHYERVLLPPPGQDTVLPDPGLGYELLAEPAP